MKLRLKYYKVIMVLALGILSLVIPFFYISKITFASKKDIVEFIFAVLLVIYILIRLWKMIFFDFYQVEFSQSAIKLKNIITQKQTIIETYITGFKINPVNGKFSLVDNDGDVVAILNAFHYFNVPEAIEYLNLKRK